MKIYSWNVNSLRSCEYSFIDFVNTYSPDIVFIQELRAHPDQLSFFLKGISGYNYLFNDSGRPGYSGTAVYYKDSLGVESVSNSVNNILLDIEGRIIYLRVRDINSFGVYIPNGTSSQGRLDIKMRYHDELLSLAKKYIDNGEKVVIGGDFNVGHTVKDLYNPNHKGSGFLPEERAWFDNMLSLGMKDSFRLFNNKPGQYTWWHLGDPKREKNRGWRFDYFLISNNLINITRDVGILKEVFGSDHCPIYLDLDI